MRILVTNDDGVHARGLAAAELIARQLARETQGEVWVVAPQEEQSGASRSLSLAAPLRVRELGARRFAVRGTPADCVIMAVCELMPRRPDIIISGVNRGQNVADDITYSGTIAAAMEGAVLGIPSFALSQCYLPEHADAVPWQVAEAHGAAVIRAMLRAHGPDCLLFNVNFPDCAVEEVAGPAITRQGKRDVQQLLVETRMDPRRQPYYWISFRRGVNSPPVDSDLFAIFNRRISVTPLKMNLTDEQARVRLCRALEESGAGEDGLSTIGKPRSSA